MEEKKLENGQKIEPSPFCVPFFYAFAGRIAVAYRQ